MIDFNSLNIDDKVIQDIKQIGNSCGVISCYILSLVFDFEFNIEGFRNIGNGMSSKQIQDYAYKNGVKYMSMESSGGKRDVSFSDYSVLLKNNILIDLAATNLNGENKPHTSILTDVNGDDFNAIFHNRLIGVTKFSKLENRYYTFYHNCQNADDFVRFY